MHVTWKDEITNSKNGYWVFGIPAHPNDAAYPTDDDQASDMPLLPPLNFPKWLNENQNLLQPPVNNFCIFKGGDFIVMAVGGPNERLDYHVNETEVCCECLLVFCIVSMDFLSASLGVVLSTQRRNASSNCGWRKISWYSYRGRRDVLAPWYELCMVTGLLFSMPNTLPANTPHNPVRFADTIGLVVERVRPVKSKGNVLWCAWKDKLMTI